MNVGIYALILIGLFLILMIVGVPIAFSLMISAMMTVFITGQFTNGALVHRFVDNSSSYTLLAISFFILAAKFMNVGGITDRIFNFATAAVGWIPGGLGHANILASVVFSGMSGSAVADAGGLGQVEVDAMKKQGFDADFSAAVTCASATIGPIIPPSIPMIVYGTMTETSVGSLFLGGVIPGLIMALACGVLCFYIAKRRHYPTVKFNLSSFGAAFGHAFLSLLTPVIIIGGIWTGVFSPTEAACVAAAYAFILAVIVYREMSMKVVWQCIVETVRDSAGIMVIICGAAAFSWLVTMLGITNAMSAMLASATTNKYVMLAIINVAFLLIGCFMEALAAMTITIPFLIPLMATFGINPIHLGVVMVLNLMIGLSTPPVGTSLFICAKVAGISIEKMYKAILPWLVPLLATLILITYCPALVTWLPTVVFGG